MFSSVSQMYKPIYICNIFYFLKLYLIGAMYHFYLNCLFVTSFLFVNLMRNLTILLKVFQRPHVGFIVTTKFLFTITKISPIFIIFFLLNFLDLFYFFSLTFASCEQLASYAGLCFSYLILTFRNIHFSLRV